MRIISNLSAAYVSAHNGTVLRSYSDISRHISDALLEYKLSKYLDLQEKWSLVQIMVTVEIYEFVRLFFEVSMLIMFSFMLL